MLLEPELLPLPIEPVLGELVEPLLLEELGELLEDEPPLDELLPELDGLAEEPLEDEPDLLK